MAKKQTYDSSQIEVLEGLAAVRMRPGMYIGTTSARGLHHLVWEIVDNSIDEHLAGHADTIKIVIHKDESITVTDNGRGIPVDIHPKHNIPSVEVILTVLHAGGKFGGGGYKVSGGLHGVGSTVVNALSKQMIAKVKRNGKEYEIKFEEGVTVSPLKVVREFKDEDDTGTSITFHPDEKIFKETVIFDLKTIHTRMRESAFLNPGLTLVVVDEREIDPETNDVLTETFHYDGGLVDYVKYINQAKTPLHEEVIYITETKDDVQVDIALQYQDGYGKEGIFSYANNVKTPEGGTHEDGFRKALTTSIKNYIQLHELIKSDDLPSAEDMRVGLTAVISVKVPEPEFEGQTKGRLGNSEVRGIVDNVVLKKMEFFLANNPAVAKYIVQKIVDSFEERLAARKARQDRRTRNEQNEYASFNMPEKLADCERRTPVAERELFLVEGNSAGGSAKQARDRRTQAILPLRGKVINTEKATMEKIYANVEIDSIKVSIGTDMEENFNLDNRRYDKIIIMTDADVDGEHIRCLLLTFFYRFMRPLIENGNVYLAQPPLYGLKNGNKVLEYCGSEKELEEAKLRHPNAKVQRYKGLGEMNKDQLKNTTMDKNQRTLIQITIEDAAEAESVFHMLMGDESNLRKDFIQKNGHKADIDA